MSVIEVSNLVKYYDDIPAVQNVSFSLGREEAVGLLGLNGAGKTTILRILAGYLVPTSGEVKIAGHNLASDPLEIKKQLGYLPETPPLYRDMGVREYLAYAARLRGISEEAVGSLVERAIEKTSLQSVAGRLISSLSLGFRKRVGIAQAIVHDPPVVILDEPISGLDPRQIIEMRSLITELKAHHSILLSSHILSEVSKTCDRFLLIHEGRIRAEQNRDVLLARLEGKGLRRAAFVNLNQQGREELQTWLKARDYITSFDVQSHGELLQVTLECPGGPTWKKDLLSFAEDHGSDLAWLQDGNHAPPDGDGELENVFMELLK